jgi:hypothetical protein
MIKVEHNTLVLDTSHTRDDQKAINDFLEYKIQETKVSLLKAVQEIEEQSHKTRTPIYQDALFNKIRNIINETV